MQRKVNENKGWRRDSSPQDAWDIDKEMDANMYKRESLERLMSLTVDEPENEPLVCVGCSAPVTDRSHEAQKVKQHEHTVMYGEVGHWGAWRSS